MGTIEYRVAGEVRHAANTTPESLDVLRLAAELEQRGGSRFTMEVSSHALALGRVSGIRFHTAVFTNLTRDHLDFHHTMEEYAAAKRTLFVPVDSPAPAWSVLNFDDPAAQGFTNPASRMVWYGLSPEAALTAENVTSGFDGLRFDLRYEGARQPVESPLVGQINVLNILAAAAVGISYGIDLPTIARGIAECRAVPGRFERVDAGQPFLVVVDYAHTDDALRNVIQVARELTRGRVITLFGCGGDRDRSKRPLMGMAAARAQRFCRADVRQSALGGSARHHERCDGGAAAFRYSARGGTGSRQGNSTGAGGSSARAMLFCWRAKGMRLIRY